APPLSECGNTVGPLPAAPRSRLNAVTINWGCAATQGRKAEARGPVMIARDWGRFVQRRPDPRGAWVAGLSLGQPGRAWSVGECVEPRCARHPGRRRRVGRVLGGPYARAGVALTPERIARDNRVDITYIVDVTCIDDAVGYLFHVSSRPAGGAQVARLGSVGRTPTRPVRRPRVLLADDHALIAEG